MNFLKKYGYCIWLGLSLGIVGFAFYTWQFWLVMLPIVLLVVWRSDNDGCPHKDQCKYYKECPTCDSDPDFCGCYKHWEERTDAHLK